MAVAFLAIDAGFPVCQRAHLFYNVFAPEINKPSRVRESVSNILYYSKSLSGKIMLDCIAFSACT
jgi:hypothetical protein